MKEITDNIRDSEIYPVISDSNKNISSLPPLIYNDHSKIKLSTKMNLLK